ncbi:MAG: hypothetical protein IJR42_01335 [Paludibacteraceae bacterium]|nr:hypothetical protein [Paludibacteraceae bacterium]
MLENQFIKCASSTPSTWGAAPVFVIVGSARTLTLNHINLFVPGDVTKLTYLLSGVVNTYTVDVASSTNDYKIVGIRDDLWHIWDWFLGGQAKVVVQAKRGDGTYLYSNPIILLNEAVDKDSERFAFVKYRCDEDALGFPFSQEPTKYVSIDLPIRLHSPQLVQDEKTYVKANGEVVTLYAKYYKEWDGETEYLSAEMHDKIVAALSCDEVYINGKRVTKSEKYEIAWDAYDLDCDGETKLAMATFKVREHITQRNSNY